mgnify:CR=1 FL=1
MNKSVIDYSLTQERLIKPHSFLGANRYYPC